MGAVLTKKRSSVASGAVLTKRRSVLMRAVLAKKKRASVLKGAVLPKKRENEGNTGSNGSRIFGGVPETERIDQNPYEVPVCTSLHCIYEIALTDDF